MFNTGVGKDTAAGVITILPKTKFLVHAEDDALRLTLCSGPDPSFQWRMYWNRLNGETVLSALLGRGQSSG